MVENGRKQTAHEEALKLLQKEEQKRATLRFERGVLEFENGRYNILNNQEFIKKLGPHLCNEFAQGRVEESQSKLDILFSLLPEKAYIEDIRKVVYDVFRVCLSSSNIRLMQYVCQGYSHLLEDGNNKKVVDAVLCDHLTKSAEFFVRSSLWKDFQRLLDLLWKIRNITYSEHGEITAPFKDVFSKIGSKDVVEKILQLHKIGDDEQKALACRAMNYFGEDAILYLLNRLVFSNTKEERFKLIELIRGLGEEVIRIIEKFIQENLPWYALRNLILLIADLGNAQHYTMIEGYLIHPDQRVQQQVIACMIKLGGDELPERLVQALPVVDNTVKLKLVMQLSRFRYEVIANGLIEILINRSSLPKDIHDDLIYRICITLRSYPYSRVTNVLHEIVRSNTEKQHLHPKIAHAIQETIHFLEPKVRHQMKGENADSEGMSFEFDPDLEKIIKKNVDDFLQEITEMVHKGKVEKATSLMFKRAKACARAKDFHTAEMLRDKLLEVNPDALQDVIRLAEIIEEEKELPNSGVETDVWDDFFEQLTPEEYKCIMGCFHIENYTQDEKIAGIGEINPCLYFFSSGAARMSCSSGRNETFLKKVNPGDIIGAGTFFTASVWTVNLYALQRTQVQVLQRNEFLKSCKDQPAIEDKLKEYIVNKENIRDLVKMSGRERRDFARYHLNIVVNNTLLDPYGEKEGSRVFQGEMLDISRGGLSFAIRLKNKESANLLLGRQLVSEIVLKEKDHLQCLGTIVGVKFKHELAKEFSIHVRFVHELEQSKVTEVLNVVI